MTAIANPIRTLSGSSGAMTLDQMAQMLTAANGSVTDILAALTEKGVDTTGAGLSDVAALIAGIQAGGGTKIETGEFTLTEDAQQYEVTHSLGETPKVLLCWVKTYITAASYLTGGMGVMVGNVDENIPIYNTGTTTKAHYFYPGNSTHPSITGVVGGTQTKNGAFYAANPSSFRICYAGNSTTIKTDYKLKSGVTYVWVAVA